MLLIFQASGIAHIFFLIVPSFLSEKIGILVNGVYLPILYFDASVIKSTIELFKPIKLRKVFALAAAPIPTIV